MPSIAVLVPSSGRNSLYATVASIVPQLQPGDELHVDVNADDDYGNKARRRLTDLAGADLIAYQDDDDSYFRGALNVFRTAAERDPGRVLIGRMIYAENQHVLWSEPDLREGNVASQMICVPNVPHLLGTWTDRRESDFDFISSTCENLGDPVWLEQIVSVVAHPELREEGHDGG